VFSPHFLCFFPSRSFLSLCHAFPLSGNSQGLSPRNVFITRTFFGFHVPPSPHLVVATVTPPLPPRPPPPSLMPPRFLWSTLQPFLIDVCPSSICFFFPLSVLLLFDQAPGRSVPSISFYLPMFLKICTSSCSPLDRLHSSPSIGPLHFGYQEWAVGFLSGRFLLPPPSS